MIDDNDDLEKRVNNEADIYKIVLFVFKIMNWTSLLEQQ